MISNVFDEYIGRQLKEYYICYFDILGYRAVFEDAPLEHGKFLSSIMVADGIFQSAIRRASTTKELQIGYKMYSDNFILYFEKDIVDEMTALLILVKIMREIQIRFLFEEELLLRGAITVGEFYVNDDFVFGEGLVRATDLEENDAKMPRIIIDDRCFQKSKEPFIDDGRLIRDHDGICFVNYFDSYESLRLIKGKCIRLINRYCKYKYNVKDPNKISQTERTIGKYTWLLVQFNSACIRMGHSHFAIEYEIKINERLCKTEIYANPLKKSGRLKQ